MSGQEGDGRIVRLAVYVNREETNRSTSLLVSFAADGSGMLEVQYPGQVRMDYERHYMDARRARTILRALEYCGVEQWRADFCAPSAQMVFDGMNWMLAVEHIGGELFLTGGNSAYPQEFLDLCTSLERAFCLPELIPDEVTNRFDAASSPQAADAGTARERRQRFESIKSSFGKYWREPPEL